MGANPGVIGKTVQIWGRDVENVECIVLTTNETAHR